MLLLLFCSFFNFVLAQEKNYSFKLAGDSKKVGKDCYRLTEARDWSSGSLWASEPIDLNEPFEMELELFLGCEDRYGADGMVFVFVPNPLRPGYAGEGMGFAGLRPSLGIEIDTWQNFHLEDPAKDHVALLANGQVHHNFNLAGPIYVPNLEDCRAHPFKIFWKPDKQFLDIYMDGKKILVYKGDIVKNIFKGNAKVYWGVTAGTGNHNNRQEICIENLVYSTIEDEDFDEKTANKLRNGDILNLDRLSFESGKATISTSSYAQLNKLTKFLKENPSLSLEIMGHTDSWGAEKANKELSQMRAEAVARYLHTKGISMKRLFPSGYGEKFPISSNNTADGREKNRRVDIHAFIPRV